MAPCCLLDRASGLLGCCGPLLRPSLTLITRYQASMTCTQHPPLGYLLHPPGKQFTPSLRRSHQMPSPRHPYLTPSIQPLALHRARIPSDQRDRHFFRSPCLLMTEESRDDFVPLSCPPLLFLTQWQRCRTHSRLQLNREQQEGVRASASSTLKAEARRGFWPEVWT